MNSYIMKVLLVLSIFACTITVSTAQIAKSPAFRARIDQICSNDNDCLIDMYDSYCNLATRTCEKNVANKIKCSNETSTVGKCKVGECECSINGECILRMTVCDAYSDCDNGEDEATCGCPDDMFSCIRGGDCVPKEAVCDKKQDCLDGSDEFSCVSVGLNQACEMHEQCARSDPNTYCYKSTCSCIANFTDVNGTCRQKEGQFPLTCKSHDQCSTIITNSVCLNNNKCGCGNDSTISHNNKTCLPDRGFNESCTENKQCLHKLGTGATCNSVCRCDAGYNMIQHQQKNICMWKKTIGDHCSTYNDCVSSMETESMMECFNSACVCRKEYVVPGSNEKCAKKDYSSGSSSNQEWSLLILILVPSIFVNRF